MCGDEEPQIVARTLEVAERLGRPPAQVALAWLLSNPAVTAPIVGVTKPQHLTVAVGAVDLDLAGADIAALEGPYQAHPVSGHV